MVQGSKANLANSELAVMDLLWEHGSAMTAREIRESLYPSSNKAQHGTVQRLLQRLEEKGFVSRDKSLSVHFFAPEIARNEYAGRQLEALAEKLTAGTFAPLITHLVEHNKITAKDISRIRNILDQHDAGNASKRLSTKGSLQKMRPRENGRPFAKR